MTLAIYDIGPETFIEMNQGAGRMSVNPRDIMAFGEGPREDQTWIRLRFCDQEFIVDESYEVIRHTIDMLNEG